MPTSSFWASRPRTDGDAKEPRGRLTCVMAKQNDHFRVCDHRVHNVVRGIGPIGAAIVFGGLTAGVHRPDRFRLAWQAVSIAGAVLLAFALLGNRVLSALHVSLDAFRVAAAFCFCSIRPDDQRPSRSVGPDRR